MSVRRQERRDEDVGESCSHPELQCDHQPSHPHHGRRVHLHRSHGAGLPAQHPHGE
ncbi:MAG: hypothetical protein HRT39_14590 [Alteromonas sp.]|nr:hypothetical protein [Alteromonas sp.]